ncbi:MAG: Hpt domain-containing protein [Pseudotabrizicola sp.]|uniref:Hpt domain-containing protein n=1 Tax=Pseudotabrizicola sp. TaxID=2939647 RepID=UPI00272518CE|nr:Hpt domain-containing protein [Pseudotabrizicola sp.]MDO8881436.1 Hpt domain-containing protein [Pseudotabrizicola sp.]MDP2083370.1 Hpt domain-containing protein [Pseudotabrizicola sp.]MDZ7574908.1 Hpt domain-containing protein [Pseudotabrizicola sp.]
MIDWGRVQELQTEIGPDCFGEIVALFLEEADDVISRLRALADARSLENDLHFLKGSALNLGFSDLARICQNGEREAASGSVDVAIETVIEIYQKSRSAFLGGINGVAA